MAAHPDDVEYSCLGFLAHVNALGASISVYIAGTGSKFDETSGPHRQKETESALKPFGFDVIFSQHSSLDYYMIEKEVRDLILTKQFDCVLVHDPNDTHQEHRLMYEITTSALRRTVCAVLRYRSVSSTSNFLANLFLDISDYLPEKIDALNKHKSQKNKSYMQPSTLEAFHTYYHPGDAPTLYFEQFFIEKMYI